MMSHYLNYEKQHSENQSLRVPHENKSPHFSESRQLLLTSLILTVTMQISRGALNEESIRPLIVQAGLDLDC